MMNKSLKAIVKAAEARGFKVDRKNPIRKTEVIDNTLHCFLNAKPEKIKITFRVGGKK
jgi:hypothetical protein